MRDYGKAVKAVNDSISMFNQFKDWRAKYQVWRDEKRYQIVIKENETLYTPLLRWIVDNSINEPKEVQAISRTDNRTNSKVIDYYFHGQVSQKMIINGHPVEIVADDGRSSSNGATPDGAEVKASIVPTPCLRIYTSDLKGRNAIMEFLTQLAQDNKLKVQLYRISRWGDWYSQELQTRDLDSVILKEDTKERIVEDLNRFISSEELYVQWGLPWHRGYLLYGVPGTGKTSLIKALASKLQLNVYFVNIGSLKSDSDLEQAIGGLRVRSILVLEDIDAVNGALDRNDEKYDPESGGVSATGLYNVLDGINTPHGMITIMTTNYIDKLDPALIRSGRADLHIELGYLDDEQFDKMCQRFFGHSLSLSVEGLTIPPADIVEIFKANIDDIGRAEAKVKEFITERNV